MFALFLIAARNLKRSWFRTVFTIAGASFALMAFIMIRTFNWSWNAAFDYAASDRIASRHKVSFIMQLPKRYIDDVRGVPGVKAATWMNWFGARIPTKPDEFFANMAVDEKTFLDVIDEAVVDEASKKRWLEDKKGALVGDVLAKKMGWKVGDKDILEGTIYPGDWEFNVSGIYPATRKSLDRSQFLFHWDYLNDSLPPARRDQIGWISARIGNVSQSGDISQRIDTMFDERDVQTTTMSERAMNASFMAGFSTILTALKFVSFVILLIMLLILGNTIAMGVRERTKEYAVLRAIGFEPGHIRFFVIGEALALGIITGAVGLGISYPFINNVIGRALEENMGAMFPYFRVDPFTAGLSVVLAIVLAVTASLIPAMRAGNISVTDALRRVG
jgi:putative ABC transport system permease protein